MHLDPSRVTAVLFDGRHPFFLPEDKVQVKYEMLRAHLVDGMSVTAAAATHGYSRAAFYLVATSFSEAGMAGLVDEQSRTTWTDKAHTRNSVFHCRRRPNPVGGGSQRGRGRTFWCSAAPAHGRARAR